MTYRGRFAPSPTGPLHLGSLVAALGSYLDAHAHQGEWLVRIEDLDGPRTVPGAADDILRTLEAFGFTWDGPVAAQSQRREMYQAALDSLVRRSLAYACSCTRSELQAMQTQPPLEGDELRYPGLCRDGLQHPDRAIAWRLRVNKGNVSFHDDLQGDVTADVSETVGDFVIKRRDGFFAYQLAVVVDDAAQGITDVVRGCDLLASTPRQLLLQHALELPTPRYRHLPVVIGSDGRKLGKSHDAPPVIASHANRAMHAALQYLQQSPPADLARAPVAELWQWAKANWRAEACRNIRVVPQVLQQE